MISKLARLSTIVAVATIAGACTTGGAQTTAPTPPPVALQATAVVATPAPTVPPASSAEPSGPVPTPGSIDPCSLITQPEAETLDGKTLSAGVSSTVDQDRECTFKSGLTEVKLILAPPAPDVATATSYWDAERAQVPAGVPITDLTDFDRSAYGSGSAGGLSISALFVISGTTFFDLYCGLPSCSQTASVTAAQAVVGRLP